MHLESFTDCAIEPGGFASSDTSLLMSNEPFEHRCPLVGSSLGILWMLESCRFVGKRALERVLITSVRKMAFGIYLCLSSLDCIQLSPTNILALYLSLKNLANLGWFCNDVALNIKNLQDWVCSKNCLVMICGLNVAKASKNYRLWKMHRIWPNIYSENQLVSCIVCILEFFSTLSTVIRLMNDMMFWFDLTLSLLVMGL